MSLASLVVALDAFASNDMALRDQLLAQKDTELAELDMQMSQHKARIAAQKQAIIDEFDQRSKDLKLITDGKA